MVPQQVAGTCRSAAELVRDVTEVTECIAGAAQLSFEIMGRAKDGRLWRARCKRCEREAEQDRQNSGLSEPFHNYLHKLRTALQYPWFISVPQPRAAAVLSVLQARTETFFNSLPPGTEISVRDGLTDRSRTLSGSCRC